MSSLNENLPVADSVPFSAQQLVTSINTSSPIQDRSLSCVMSVTILALQLKNSRATSSHTHTGEKPFACKQCGYSSSQSVGMKYLKLSRETRCLQAMQLLLQKVYSVEDAHEKAQYQSNILKKQLICQMLCLHCIVWKIQCFWWFFCFWR